MTTTIAELGSRLGVNPDVVIPHGRNRAKIELTALDGADVSASGAARSVLVTAVTPTPAGEGKTVTSIGLASGLRARGHRAVATLRQSSLGPTFGRKGGGAGGGRASLFPLDEALLGLGSDLFAVETANNLLAAALDNARFRGTVGIDPATVDLHRVVDVNDRALRRIVTYLDGKADGDEQATGFDITAASEVMAVLTLAHDLEDLQDRLGRIVVGLDVDVKPVTAADLRVAGAMAVLLRRAAEPNLLGTPDGTPVLVHAGPFGNLSVGVSSVMADRIALASAEWVVTEAGFAADLGAEKYLHLKVPAIGRHPDAIVLVATVRAMRHHGGADDLERADTAAVEAGTANLESHLRTLLRFGRPVVVALNRMPGDTEDEVQVVATRAREAGASAVASHTAYADGPVGAVDLATAVEDAVEDAPVGFTPLLDDPDAPIVDKVERLATEVYGAGAVEWDEAARRQLERLDTAGYGRMPVCVSKTHASLSHDASLRGAPTGFTFPVRRLRLAAGAGYVTVMAGDVLTMPGLPPAPRFETMGLGDDGDVVGVV